MLCKLSGPEAIEGMRWQVKLGSLVGDAFEDVEFGVKLRAVPRHRFRCSLRALSGVLLRESQAQIHDGVGVYSE